MAERFQVVFFEKADGTQPAKEFILSVDKKMQAKVLRTIELLLDYGPLPREPFSKSLDDGLFELRAQQGNDITRVLYFFRQGSKVILTNGFIKKTQKTPDSVLELAKKYREEYLAKEDRK